jgi:hypothetical protein
VQDTVGGQAAGQVTGDIVGPDTVVGAGRAGVSD